MHSLAVGLRGVRGEKREHQAELFAVVTQSVSLFRVLRELVVFHTPGDDLLAHVLTATVQLRHTRGR